MNDTVCWKWQAVDADGSVYWYENRPELLLDSKEWEVSVGRTIARQGIAIHNIPWYDTLKEI